MTDALLGKALGGYTLTRLLGHGGMARVYEGVHPKTREQVAIKVIQPEAETQFDYATRFERESQAIEKLKHPHIVGFKKSGKSRGTLYLVMEYIEGDDLADVLRRYQRQNKFMPEAEALKILQAMGAALDYSHQQGVIHRDIKPSNIMIKKDGQAILTDFGLALLAEVGTKGEIFGTPRYISPEQAISSAAVVPQSDLYALGVIAYEMFCGRVPFEAENSVDAAMLHMTEKPPSPVQFRPDLSPALAKVLLKMLEKEPERRYRTGAEFAAAVDKALHAPAKRTTTNTAVPKLPVVETVPTVVPRPPVPAVTPKRPARRFRLLILVLLFLLLLIVAALIRGGVV